MHMITNKRAYDLRLNEAIYCKRKLNRQIGEDLEISEGEQNYLEPVPI